MLCNAAGEGLDYKAMGSIFSGLVQCGAWGCFDEFNRIEAEVLSVVSSQIRQIQEALKNGLTRFPFEGKGLWPISSALDVLHAAAECSTKSSSLIAVFWRHACQMGRFASHALTACFPVRCDTFGTSNAKVTHF